MPPGSYVYASINATVDERCCTHAGYKEHAPHLLRFKACSTSRRTASGRVGFGAGWLEIQASSARNSAGGKRVFTGTALIRGRPRPRADFLALGIDFM
jgi:hypothetical protein